MPRENSFTFTPKIFAKVKCPASCTMIIMPKNIIASRIVHLLASADKNPILIASFVSRATSAHYFFFHITPRPVIHIQNVAEFICIKALSVLNGLSDQFLNL